MRAEARITAGCNRARIVIQTHCNVMRIVRQFPSGKPPFCVERAVDYNKD